MFQLFSTNSKTGYSYDFGICPLMKENSSGKFKAFCGVDKCYSVQRLNSHRGKHLQNKLNRIPELLGFLESEVKILNALHGAKDILVRGFSFGDYMPEFREEFLYILRNLQTRHIIISKTLWLMAPELVEETGNKTELSLGFTKQLYPKFKKFLSKYSGLKFSIAFTYAKLDELEWLKSVDPGLLQKVDVLHDEYIHFTKGRQFSRYKETQEFTKSAIGMQRNFKKHLAELSEIHPNAGTRQCNIWGVDQKIKACADCVGCGTISRRSP